MMLYENLNRRIKQHLAISLLAVAFGGMIIGASLADTQLFPKWWSGVLAGLFFAGVGARIVFEMCEEAASPRR
jgi:hypothetical protein